MRATVIIPVRSGADVIATQLEALAAQDRTDFELLICDNGSSDATVEIARGWRERFAALRIIDCSGAAGVSVARNGGAQAAATPLLLFADADDRADPHWVSAMVDAFAQADLVGGAVETAAINAPEVLAWTQAPDSSALPTALRYLPYAVGANLGVRKEVWAKLGGFDNSYIGGHEEVDFCWRAQRAGYRLAYAPDAIMHYRLRDTLKGAVKQRYNYGRSNAQLQARFRDEPALPPFTRRRAVRILGSHLWHWRAVLDPNTRGGWLTGLGWTVGRLRGVLEFQRNPERAPHPESR